MSKRPNIMLIEVDQLTAKNLSCYGNPVIKTPNIDALAGDSFTTSNCFCNYPACSPSRSSMFTGRYPHTIKVHANHMHIPEYELTLPEVMKDNGYRTALIGKNHAFKKPHLAKAWDLYINGETGHLVSTYLDDEVVMAAHNWSENVEVSGGYAVTPFPHEKTSSPLHAAETIKYINESVNEDAPFFMWLSFPEPHPPYQVTEEYASLYPPEIVPKPIVDSMENKPDRHLLASKMDAMDSEGIEKWVAGLKSIYFGMINSVDDALGQIIAEMKKLGIYDNTIIIFTADHGDAMGDHGLVQKLNFFYDCFTNVPFTIMWKDHIKPDMNNVLVELIDIYPTLLDLVDIEAPFGIQGKSLKPVLMGDLSKQRDFVVMESGENIPATKLSDIKSFPEKPYTREFFPWNVYREAWCGKGKSIRTKEWKFNLYLDGGGELYNLVNDPDELINLYTKEYEEPRYVGEYSGIINKMKMDLLLWCIDTEDKIPENTTVKAYVAVPKNKTIY